MESETSKFKPQSDLISAFNKQINFLTKFCYEYDLGNEDISIMIAGILRTLLNDSESIKNYDSTMLNQAEKLKSICEVNRNFNSNENFKEAQKLARTIHGQIKNSQKNQTHSISLLGMLNGKNVPFIDTLLVVDRFSGYSLVVPPGKNTVNDYFEKMRDMVHRDKHPYAGLCIKHMIIDNDKKINTPKFYPLSRDPKFNIDTNTKRVSFNDWWNAIVFDDFTGTNKLSRKNLIKTVADKDGYAHVDRRFYHNYETYKNPRQIKLGYLDDEITARYENTPVGATIRQIAFELLHTIESELAHLIDKSIPNMDYTPTGRKLRFEVTIDSEEREKQIISLIFSNRPFIQRVLLSSHFKENSTTNKTITIDAIMPTELQKIIATLNENNIEMRNVEKMDL